MVINTLPHCISVAEINLTFVYVNCKWPPRNESETNEADSSFQLEKRWDTCRLESKTTKFMKEETTKENIGKFSNQKIRN